MGGSPTEQAGSGNEDHRRVAHRDHLPLFTHEVPEDLPEEDADQEVSDVSDDSESAVVRETEDRHRC